jgi:hypothetical protein
MAADRVQMELSPSYVDRRDMAVSEPNPAGPPGQTSACPTADPQRFVD